MHRHEVKVSPEEEAQLLALAEKHRVTIPRLLIEAALSEATENPSERRDQFMQLSNLQRLVGSVANNINQIARHTPCECHGGSAGRSCRVHRSRTGRHHPDRPSARRHGRTVVSP
jgi:hypothetical protein